MSLLLAIESSSNEYRVVIGNDGEMSFDSVTNNCGLSLKTLGNLFSCGLESIGVPASEVKGIAVNVGPGSLTFVRAGISFVNALAFSLKVPIYPFNWFEIIANQVDTNLPVVCAVPASNDNAYVGLIRDRAVRIMRFGLLPVTLARVSEGLGDVAVAGRIRQRLVGLLGESKVIDTGIEGPDGRVLLGMAHQAVQVGGRSTTQVAALNDQSKLFFD